MSAEVAEAIRQTRCTLAEKTWVPRVPDVGETCVVYAIPYWADHLSVVAALWDAADADCLGDWNDRQTDVGAVLGMTLQALINELCKVSA